MAIHERRLQQLAAWQLADNGMWFFENSWRQMG